MPDAPRVAELGLLLGGEVIGDADRLVRGIASLAHAGPDSISFLAHPRYAAQLQSTQAGCVILSLEHREVARRLLSAILVADPYAAYAALSRWWAARLRKGPEPGVHPSAVVAPGAMLHPEVCVGPLAVIGEGAQIEAGCEIGPQAVIGTKVRIGAGSRVGARVHLGDGVCVGQRAILHPGAVLGADGFGFAPREGRWEKIEQLGGVRLGDDVEVGANTCIDRGALDDTVIGNGVKLDNLIQIGHNVQVGDHTAMAGCVGIAGSARIGAHCTLGGGAIVLGHLDLADHVHISAATVVTRSILKPGHYSGVFPFEENALWERNAATLRQLYSLRRRLQALEGRGS